MQTVFITILTTYILLWNHSHSEADTVPSRSAPLTFPVHDMFGLERFETSCSFSAPADLTVTDKYVMQNVKGSASVY